MIRSKRRVLREKISMTTFVRIWMAIVAIVILAVTAVVSPAYAFKQADVDQLLKTRSCELCDLSGANLEDAYLLFAKLKGANLKGADLSYATLSGADLTDADLSNAKLQEAYLYRADLTGATVTETQLKSAIRSLPLK